MLVRYPCRGHFVADLPSVTIEAGQWNVILTTASGQIWTEAQIEAAHQNKGTKMMNFGYNSVLGILILIGDIWAIINIFQSSASNEKKLIWIVVVVLLPVLGLILWFFLGPRDRKA